MTQNILIGIFLKRSFLWYPCFGLLVTSPLGFKARVASFIRALWRCTHSWRFTSGVTPADSWQPTWQQSHFLPRTYDCFEWITKHFFKPSYRPQRSWGKVIFSEACVNNSVHGGVCMVALGGQRVWLHGGHVWFYSGGAWFYSGGIRGFIWGACMVLFGGACMVLYGEACVVLFGGCMVLFGGAYVVLFGGMHGFIWGGMHGFILGGTHDFIRGACMVLFGGHAWFYSVGGGMHGFIQQGGMRGFIQQGGHAWFFQFFRIQWDTVNERAVRILLECILVLIKVYPVNK